MDGLPDLFVLAQTASGMADAVEIVDRTTYQGPLSMSQSLWIGSGLVLLCGIALWAESRFTGRRWVLLFWPLRAVIVGVTLWMLLGPTHTTLVRRSQRKSLAVVADVSGSMLTEDAPDPPADYRWSLAAQPTPGGTLLPHCDRLLASVTEARRQLSAAHDLARHRRKLDTLRPLLEAALGACKRSERHLEEIGNVSGTFSAELSQAAVATQTAYRDDIIPGISRLLDRDSGATPQARAADLRSLELQAARSIDLAHQLAASALDAELARAGHSPPLDRGSSPVSRREKALGLLEVAESTWLRAAEEEARVQRWAFHRSLFPVAGKDWRHARDAEPPDEATDQPQPATDLAGVLEQLGRSAASDRLEAVVLLSDGRHNAIGTRDPAEVAAGLGRLPIYVVPIGDDRLIRDISVHHLDAPRAVSRDDKIVLESLITTVDCQGEQVQVQLIAKDRFGADEVVDRYRFTPDSRRSDQPVTFTTQRSELGRYQFAVRVLPLADEASLDNNLQEVHVDVVDNNIKILLADNSPRWEFRFLSNLFQRDGQIEYDHLIFHPAPAGTGDLANAARLPSDVSEWGRYRVAILGDLPPAQLTRAGQNGLRDFVAQRGGTVILIAGSEAMPAAFEDQPLGELLPVTSAGAPESGASYSIALSAEGRMSAAVQVASDPSASERVWREAYQFAPVQWISEFRRPKPTAHTLLFAVSDKGSGTRAHDDAFLSWQTIGRGRVVYLSAPASYRLRARHGDVYHHAFWGQLLRWSIAPELASGSKTVRISTDKQRYDASEPVQVTVQLRGTDGEPLRLAKAYAEARQLDRIVGRIELEADEQIPGQFRGRFEQLPAGSYLIHPSGDDVKSLLARENFTGDVNAAISLVQQLSEEMNDTRSNPVLLARIAEVTGGQVIPPTAADEVIHLASLTPRITETESHQPLWNTWWSLGVISGCLIFEWIVRKCTHLL